MQTIKKQNKHVRQGDQVYILSGNERGRTGKVLKRTDAKVVVSGVNVRKKHVKPTELNPKGGIVEMEKPIDVSNVAIAVDENKAHKLRVSKDDNGNKSLTYSDGKKVITYRSLKKDER